jgi:hypothetical protein
VKWYKDFDLSLRGQIEMAMLFSPVAGLVAAIPVTGIWLAACRKRKMNPQQENA